MTVKFVKDPDGILDFTVDFSAWLTGDDVIVHTEFFPDPGLGVVSTNHTDTTASVWLSSGADGSNYDVVCHIVTREGRQDDRTFQLVVKET